MTDDEELLDQLVGPSNNVLRHLSRSLENNSKNKNNDNTVKPVLGYSITVVTISNLNLFLFSQLNRNLTIIK